MNKQSELSGHTIRQIVIRGETSNTDKGALICDLFMLGIFSWNQICYGMDMLFLIIPLALIGCFLFLFCAFAEEYHFTDGALEIKHRFRKTVMIPYESVFNYEASTHDSFVNILQSNKVKVYFTQSKKRKIAMCMPKDVVSFVEVLKWNCPELYEETQEKSKLEVFFNNKERNNDE